MALEVVNLSKRFGATQALDQVSFQLPEHGIYGFVGPNGAGKTTALRIMAGLDLPDSGDVLLNGISLVDYPEKGRRQLGYMPDTLPDSGTIKVGELLDFYARAFGFSGTARQQRLREVKSFTQLGELEKKFLGELSKGMKQRVSLARLLIHDPQVLLLDEPAAGLDPRARLELRNVLKTLAAQGKSIFLSSHILTELEELISGVVIIERGKILSSGSLAALNAAKVAVPHETIVLLPAVSEVAPDYGAMLKKLPGVIAVKNCGGREIEVELESAQFKAFMTALVETDFPLAALRRPNLSAGLEELFIASTQGQVQ